MSERISVRTNEIDEMLNVLDWWREECLAGDFDYRLERVEAQLLAAKERSKDKPRKW